MKTISLLDAPKDTSNKKTKKSEILFINLYVFTHLFFQKNA